MKNGNSKILFQNYDVDKMVVTVNGRPSVENLINSSFNSILGDKYRSSRLGDSMIGPTNFDLSVSKNRKSVIPAESKLEFGEIPMKARSSVNLNLNLNSENNMEANNLNNSNNFNKFNNNISPRLSDLKVGNLNDLSISVIHGVSTRKNSNQEGPPNTNNNTLGLSFRPSLSSSKINIASKFKKFTYKIKGKDENGNEIVNLDHANKDQILAHDLDNSDISENEKKMLDDIFFGEEDENEYLQGIDEHIEDRKTSSNYQMIFKGFISKEDKIDINNVLKNYFIGDVKDNRRNLIDNEEIISEEKIKLLESEMKKLRKFQDNMIQQKEYIDLLKNKLNTEKENLNSSIQIEKKKIEKLSKLKISKLNEYDKVKLISQKQDLNKLDLEKYIENAEEAESDAEMDKNEILEEIEKLKIKYEEKSNKYKEIIRKLKMIMKKREVNI